jgi:hypothetical protein
LVNFYQPTRRYNPEDSHLRTPPWEPKVLHFKVHHHGCKISPLDIITPDFTNSNSLGEIVDYGKVMMNYSDDTVNTTMVDAEFQRMLKKTYVQGGHKVPFQWHYSISVCFPSVIRKLFDPVKRSFRRFLPRWRLNIIKAAPNGCC